MTRAAKATAPTTLLPSAATLAALLEPHVGWVGALQGGDFHLERWLRWPGDELGGRYRIEVLRPLRGAMDGCLFVRCGTEVRSRHEIALPEAGVVFLPYPRDDALPGLHALVRDGARPLAWRPGRRAVVLERAADGARYWKVLDRKGFTRLAEKVRAPAWRALEAAGLVAVAAVDDERRAIAFAAARGASLHALLARGTAPTAEQLAAGLARFATADAAYVAAGGALPEFAVDEELNALQRACDLASRVVPEVAAPLARGVAALRRPSALGPQGLLHRDLHDKQLFLDLEGRGADDPAALQLIDADTVAHGPLALDVANLAAHFVLRELQGLARDGREQARALLSAARCSTRGAAAPARFFLATSLLRLAAVYALRPRHAALVAPLLERAQQVLAKGTLS